MRCFQELVKYGAQEVLEREYGPYIIAPESGYDFSIQVDLEDLPAEQGMANITERVNWGMVLLIHCRLHRGPR